MERTAAEIENGGDVDGGVAYWRERARRAEAALQAERERSEFVWAAVVGSSDGRVRYA